MIELIIKNNNDNNNMKDGEEIMMMKKNREIVECLEKIETLLKQLCQNQ